MNDEKSLGNSAPSPQRFVGAKIESIKIFEIKGKGVYSRVEVQTDSGKMIFLSPEVLVEVTPEAPQASPNVCSDSNSSLSQGLLMMDSAMDFFM